jgi:putative tryptophan/tyrosine transport system substrate-binding protein
MTTRRQVIAGLGAAAAWPLGAWGQLQTRPRIAVPVIGILALLASDNEPGLVTALLDALAKLGYVDGKTATVLSLYADGEQRILPMLAGNLARLRPDVIMADTAAPIKAVRSVAPDIPIVGAIMGFPVEQGLIASFSHPGGNVTGMAAYVEGMDSKVLELGMELVPGAKSMGLLIDPEGSAAPLFRSAFEAAAAKRGIGFHAAEAHVADDLDRAIRLLADAGAAFVCIPPSGMLNLNMRHIAQAAVALRLPTIVTQPEKEAGILLGYGVDYRENYQRAAIFIDRILKGAKPADLPVEFPTKLELVINTKTAKAIGLSVPPLMLARADEVIE